MMLLIAIEMALMVYATLAEGPYRMRGLIALNMVLISLFAPKLFEYHGFISNVGNVFYAAVMIMQTYIFMQYGHKAAVSTIRMTLFSLVSVLALVYAMSIVPAVAGNEVFSAAVSQVTNFSLETIFASFFAFVIGQSVLVYFLDKTNPAVAIIVAQFVDTVIFFPIAFSYSPALLGIMITGFIFKVLLTPILASPLLAKVYFSK